MSETEKAADPSAFYEQLSEHEFQTTPATASPWDTALQHGGPPAALLVRAAENVRPDETMQVARVSVEMLRGIPQGVVRTEATIVRPGRRVELIETRLFVKETLAVTAAVWRIQADIGSTAEHVRNDEVPGLPPEQPQQFFTDVSPSWGYGRAIEWRFVTGGYDKLGPAEVWARLRVPLVEGEPTSPMSRLLVLADSANGLSAELPYVDWLFIPPSLNVTVQRPGTHEWMFMDAQTSIGPDGIGIARGQVFDADGLIAEITQPLLVARRG